MRPYNVWGGVVYHGTMGKQAEAATFTVKGDWVVYKPIVFCLGVVRAVRVRQLTQL
jgi:hypothetical protein